MPRLELRLLGPLEMTLHGTPISVLTKARALLAYLAVESNRAHSRRTLAGLLWPDYAETSALTSLRTALSMLRGALADRNAAYPCLLIDRETVRLSPDGNYVIDTDALDTLRMDRLAAVDTAMLQAAADCYRGEFLANMSLDDCDAFEDWLALKREGYRRQVLRILHHLAGRHLEARAYRPAEACARRCLTLNPLDEVAYRELMRALALDGRRAETIQAYATCVEQLEADLSIAPAAETEALAESIRTGALGQRPTPAPLVTTTPPPSRATLSALHQLPPPPADFVGREGELRELMEAVQHAGARLLAICGQGGLGKTSLALALAARLESHLPDAQFYIEMRGTEEEPRSPAEAMGRVIHGFHGLADLPEGQGALAAMYRSVLHGQRALVVLDNVRDRAQVEPLLPPPPCLLLITTRQRFSLPGLLRLDLEPQSPDEATQLLRSIAPRLAADEARDLAQACGRLPLALRVAGRALAEWEDLPVEDYLSQLHVAQGRLPPELQAVEASLALSDGLLDKELQERWYALAVFSRTFDRDGAAAVWDLDGPAAQRTLSELLRYNLIDYDPAARRYWLHDLTRAYAHGRLGDDAAEQAGARHATHYAGLLVQAHHLSLEGHQGTFEALALFGRERVNIERGQQWSAEHLDAPGQAGQTAAHVCMAYVHVDSGPGTYLVAEQLDPRQRVAWCLAALRAALQVEDSLAEAEILRRLGLAYYRLGRAREALDCAERALALSRKLGNRRTEAWGLSAVSQGYYRLGQVRKSLDHAEQAFLAAQEIGDEHLQRNALHQVGTSRYALGDAQGAIEAHELALRLAQKTDLPLSIAYLSWNLGLDYLIADDPIRAKGLHEHALAIAQELGDPYLKALALTGLGRAFTLLGETDRAISCIDEALAIHMATGDRHSVGFSLLALGQALGAQRKDRQAIVRLEQSRDVLEEIDDRRGQAQALEQMALSHDRLGERERAIALAEESLALFEAVEHPRAETVRTLLERWRGAAAEDAASAG